MRIAVASGKGGTGKTLVATNLAWFLAGQGLGVAYVDTDVEEPNGHLFLHPEGASERRFTVPLPRLRGPGCSACGDCVRACRFEAITTTSGNGPGGGPGGVTVSEVRCHGCGVCLMVCPEDALEELGRPIGTVTRATAGRVETWSASLDVGEPKAAPLIGGLLAAVSAADPARARALELLDVAPGTSCSAVAATRHAHHVVLVTEPTPFGLHDLELAVEMCKALELPMSVVVNRADLGDDRVQRYLREEGIPLLGEIPFSREVATAYAQRKLAGAVVPAFTETLAGVARNLCRQLGLDAGCRAGGAS